jgi:hypothetical protein
MDKVIIAKAHEHLGLSSHARMNRIAGQQTA